MYDNIDTLKQTISDPLFGEFARGAREFGYNVRTNAATGKKEMFIAGTRTLFDWMLNVLDATFPQLDTWRLSHQRKLSKIALKNRVEVIYGYSRGGALLADMKLPRRIQKVGLSAAMIIATNKSMINLNEGGGKFGSFDYFLGFSGLYNVHVNFSPSVFHCPWKG